MATTTMVHVRVDEAIKTQAAATLADMGLSVSDAVRMLLVRVATELVDQRPPVLDGEHRQRIVDELAGRIRELLDDADLCARDAHEHLWLLLPRGDATALVREIQQLVREGSPVRVHVSARRLPDERRPAMPAAQLMAQWQPGEKEG